MAVEGDDFYGLDSDGNVIYEEWDDSDSPYYSPEYMYERDLERKQEEGYFGSDFEEWYLVEF